MMLGRRKEEPNWTFLDRKCTYWSVKFIYKKKNKIKKKRIFLLKYNPRRKSMQENEPIIGFLLRIKKYRHSG